MSENNPVTIIKGKKRPLRVYMDDKGYFVYHGKLKKYIKVSRKNKPVDISTAQRSVIKKLNGYNIIKRRGKPLSYKGKKQYDFKNMRWGEVKNLYDIQIDRVENQLRNLRQEQVNMIRALVPFNNAGNFNPANPAGPAGAAGAPGDDNDDIPPHPEEEHPDLRFLRNQREAEERIGIALRAEEEGEERGLQQGERIGIQRGIQQGVENEAERAHQARREAALRGHEARRRNREQRDRRWREDFEAQVANENEEEKDDNPPGVIPRRGIQRANREQEQLEHQNRENEIADRAAVQRNERDRRALAREGMGKHLLPALWDDQISTFFKDQPDFTGVYSIDEVKNIPKQIPQGFIINTAKHDQDGEHWQAVYISPDSVEFYDSYGDKPDRILIKQLKKKLEEWKTPTMMKFKVNNIAAQNNESETCGYFSIRFLDERFRGVPFNEATRFKTPKQGGRKVIDMTIKGEGTIKKEFSLI